jgi:hypothetical protein
MKAFVYNNEIYIRTIPAKKLFNSTMVHEVVNRGDVFALRVSDSALTIVPGTAEVEHITGNFWISYRGEVATLEPVDTQSDHV